MYYLYGHYDLDGNLFYIGKGTKGSNKKGFYNRAYSKSSRNKEWKDKSKNGFYVKIIKEFKNEKECLLEEIVLINDCEKCTNKIKSNLNFKIKIIPISNNVKIIQIGQKRKNNYYIITNDGDIYRNNGRKMTPQKHNSGYLAVALSYYEDDKLKSKIFLLHRIIAEAFIPKIKNKNIINHKNGIKTDNKIENLEWVNQAENVNHSIENKFRIYVKHNTELLQYNLHGELIKNWNNVDDIADHYKCSKNLILQTAKQNSKLLCAKGFLWVFKKDLKIGNTPKFDKIVNIFKNTDIKNSQEKNYRKVIYEKLLIKS